MMNISSLEVKHDILKKIMHGLINCGSVDERGCSYCGGLGHRITECPKLEAMQNKQAGSIGRRDYLANSAADW
jgi:hypothetical protein